MSVSAMRAGESKELQRNSTTSAGLEQLSKILRLASEVIDENPTVSSSHELKSLVKERLIREGISVDDIKNAREGVADNIHKHFFSSTSSSSDDEISHGPLTRLVCCILGRCKRKTI